MDNSDIVREFLEKIRSNIKGEDKSFREAVDKLAKTYPNDFDLGREVRLLLKYGVKK